MKTREKREEIEGQRRFEQVLDRTEKRAQQILKDRSKSDYEKLCVFCKHFEYDLGEPSYSEVTLGHPGELACLKGLWRLTSGSLREHFREEILHAKTCPHYELSER